MPKIFRGPARVSPITPPQFIRQHILGMTAAELAAKLRVASTVVSRYETTGRFPEHHHDRIMDIAAERGVKIKRAWFDAVPWDKKAGVPQ